MALAMRESRLRHATKAISLCPNLDFFSFGWINFRFPRNPSRIDANRGGHFLQADSSRRRNRIAAIQSQQSDGMRIRPFPSCIRYFERTYGFLQHGKRVI
jgi:hypothetical protein